MEKLPDNMIRKYTIIFPSQDEAVEGAKELTDDGFLLREKGLYYKGKEEVQIGYDDSIHKRMNKIELIEVIKSKKKARRKGIKFKN